MPKGTKAESKNDSEPQEVQGENPVTTKRRTFEELSKVETFQNFLQMKVIVGDFNNTDDLSEEIKESIVTQYERWMKAGQPKPSMPNLSGTVVPIITSLYRLKSNGKQKIYAYRSDGTKQGLEEIPIMQKTVDQKTGQEVVTNIPTGEIQKKYTLNYTKELGESLVDEALKTAENPDKLGFYLRDGGQKFSISSSDFNDDFDALVRKYRATQQVSLK